MNCPKCDHEMLVLTLSLFYTEYECPICGHIVYYNPFTDLDMPSLCELEGHDWKEFELLGDSYAECSRCGAIDA